MATTTPRCSRRATAVGGLYPGHRLDRGAAVCWCRAQLGGRASPARGRSETGAIDKRYLAAVRGAPPDQGVIDHPITRREDGPRVPAVTAYRRSRNETLSFTDGRPQAYALVECRPKTGRLHRSPHLKHINQPAAGHVNYGAASI